MVVWQLTETNFRAEIPLSSKRGSPWEQSPSFLHKFGKTQVLETIGESWAWIYNLKKKQRSVHVCIWDNLMPPAYLTPSTPQATLSPENQTQVGQAEVGQKGLRMQEQSTPWKGVLRCHSHAQERFNTSRLSAVSHLHLPNWALQILIITCSLHRPLYLS